MTKSIEIFVGSVNDVKIGDTLLIKSLVVEVTSIKKSAFNVEFKTLTNEGLEKNYVFGKEVFLNV